jgi:hypothetical protein
MSARTDRNRNPTAFTVAVARQAKLLEGFDFVPGDLFPGVSGLRTAKLLRDPIETTIRVIDAIGFYTGRGSLRWSYIGLPEFVWRALPRAGKARVIRWMYQREGGTEMTPLFDRYAEAPRSS